MLTLISCFYSISAILLLWKSVAKLCVLTHMIFFSDQINTHVHTKFFPVGRNIQLPSKYLIKCPNAIGIQGSFCSFVFSFSLLSSGVIRWSCVSQNMYGNWICSLEHKQGGFFFWILFSCCVLSLLCLAFLILAWLPSLCSM